MSYDPATTGETPITWGPGPSGRTTGEHESPQVERTLGFGAIDIGTAIWLPDDPGALADIVGRDGRPFNGAFVPLVIHDPNQAERSYDAAEWAADLIRGQGGASLAATPFTEKEWVATNRLTHRQWNHAAAMCERLDELCARFGLRLLVSDVIGDHQTREDGGLDPDEPIHFVLDAGNFLPDGFVPVRLLCPEQPEADSVALTDRLRGMLRGRRG